MSRSGRRRCLTVSTLALAAVLAVVSRIASCAQIRVAAGGDLQAALNNAQPGDTLVLAAGATFTGPFTLPKKTGSSWITIESSALAQLPPAGARVTPNDAPNMPRIVSPGLGQPALATVARAHHYRFIGVEFTKASAAAVVTGLINLGDGASAQNTLAQVPHDLVLDRCYIHGTPDSDVRRGVALNSAATDILGCYIADIESTADQTQAIAGWNGPGPFQIHNNYLEATGENVMFGGQDPSIPGLVPSDIDFRGNHVAKLPAWRGSSWVVCNLFETKNAQRVTIDGNVFEYCWPSAHSGMAIILTQDITISNNIIRHCAGGFNLLYTDPSQAGLPAHGIHILNNLLEDISQANWDPTGAGGNGRFVLTDGIDGLEIRHNTVFNDGPMLYTYDRTGTGFVFSDNLLAHNALGIRGEGHGQDLSALSYYFPGYVFTGNAIIGGVSTQFPAGNFFPTSWPALVNYQLPPSGPYGTAGCNIAALQAAIAGTGLAP